MLNSNSNIAVSSRSFCRSSELRTRLDNMFSNVKYNDQLEHFNRKFDKVFFRRRREIVSEDKISKNVIDALPNLKILAKFGVGLDSIDIEYLKEKILFWDGALV